MKTLIVYYSWSGNTRKIAEAIARETGGDLFEILPVTSYPRDYNDCVNQAKKEIQSGYKPELTELPADLDAYDTVFVGTPNWWSTIAPPVSAFLTRLDLSGKTVVPFCSHGGGGQARCAKDTAALCSNSTVVEGLAVYYDNMQKELSTWLGRVGVRK